MYRLGTVMCLCLLEWILTICRSVLYMLILLGMFRPVNECCVNFCGQFSS